MASGGVTIDRLDANVHHVQRSDSQPHAQATAVGRDLPVASTQGASPRLVPHSTATIQPAIRITREPMQSNPISVRPIATVAADVECDLEAGIAVRPVDPMPLLAGERSRSRSPPPAAPVAPPADYRVYTGRVIELVKASYALMALPLIRYVHNPYILAAMSGFTLSERRGVADLFVNAQALYVDFIRTHEGQDRSWWEYIRVPRSPMQTPAASVTDQKDGGRVPIWLSVVRTLLGKAVQGNMSETASAAVPTGTVATPDTVQQVTTPPLSPKQQQATLVQQAKTYTKEERLVMLWANTIDKYLRETKSRLDLLFSSRKLARAVLSDSSCASGSGSSSDDDDSNDEDGFRDNAPLSSSSSEEDEEDDSDDSLEWEDKHDARVEQQRRTSFLRQPAAAQKRASISMIANYLAESKQWFGSGTALLSGYKKIPYDFDYAGELDACCKDETLVTDFVRRALSLTGATEHVGVHLHAWEQQATQTLISPGSLVIKEANADWMKLQSAKGGMSLAEENVVSAMKAHAWSKRSDGGIVAPRAVFDIFKQMCHELRLEDTQSLYSEHLHMLLELRTRKRSEVRRNSALRPSSTAAAAAASSVNLNGGGSDGEDDDDLDTCNALLEREVEYNLLLSNLQQLGESLQSCRRIAFNLGAEMDLLYRRRQKTAVDRPLLQNQLWLTRYSEAARHIVNYASQNSWVGRMDSLKVGMSQVAALPHTLHNPALLVPRERVTISKAEADTTPSGQSERMSKLREFTTGEKALSEIALGMHYILQPIVAKLSLVRVDSAHAISSLEHLVLRRTLLHYQTELRRLLTTSHYNTTAGTGGSRGEAAYRRDDCLLDHKSVIPERIVIYLRNDCGPRPTGRGDNKATQICASNAYTCNCEGKGGVEGDVAGCGDPEVAHLATRYPYLFYLFIKYMASPFLDVEEVLPAKIDVLDSQRTALVLDPQKLTSHMSDAFDYELECNRESDRLDLARLSFGRTGALHIPTGPQKTADSDFRWVTLGFERRVTRTSVYGDEIEQLQKIAYPGVGVWSVQ